jgi:hypothetical protein
MKRLQQAFEVTSAVNYTKNPDFLFFGAIEDQVFRKSGDRHPPNAMEFVSTETAF